MAGFLDQLIEEKFPNLKEFYNTEQYKLSLKILHKKNILGKTVEEMAEILNLSKDDYLTFEDGYDSKTVTEYHEILKKISFYEILNKISSYEILNPRSLDMMDESNTDIIIHSYEDPVKPVKHNYSIYSFESSHRISAAFQSVTKSFLRPSDSSQNSETVVVEYNSTDYNLQERTEEFAF